MASKDDDDQNSAQNTKATYTVHDHSVSNIK